MSDKYGIIPATLILILFTWGAIWLIGDSAMSIDNRRECNSVIQYEVQQADIYSKQLRAAVNRASRDSQSSEVGINPVYKGILWFIAIIFGGIAICLIIEHFRSKE